MSGRDKVEWINQGSVPAKNGIEAVFWKTSGGKEGQRFFDIDMQHTEESHHPL